jgi:hypothetical protein
MDIIIFHNKVTPPVYVLALKRAVYMVKKLKLALLECVWQVGYPWA